MSNYTYYNGQRLSADEQACAMGGKCPDCRQSLLEGPSGGGSINYYCSFSMCGSKFNFSLNWERISDARPNRLVPADERPTIEGNALSALPQAARRQRR